MHRAGAARRPFGRASLVTAALAVASCTTILNIDSSDAVPPVTRDAAADGSAADGGGDAPALCAADLQKDPASCGACGHSCGTAACVGALCAPEVVPVQPTDVAPFGPNAHVAARLAAGALTDDRVITGAGQPGYVYAFDPTAAAPRAVATRTFQSHPSLVAVPTNDTVWTRTTTDGPSTSLTNKAEDRVFTGDGGTFAALVTSPGGGRVATTVSVAGSSELRVFDVPLAEVGTTPLDMTAQGVAFEDEQMVLVAGAAGVLRCPVAAPRCSVLLPSSSPVVDVALRPAAAGVFFVTASGELRAATLPAATTSQLVLAGLVTPRALAVDDSGGALVLDAAGIHATRYQPPLLVASSSGTPILSFATSAPWLYFVTKDGLYRVRY